VEGNKRDIATHLTLAFLHIYLIPQDDKGKVVRIVRTGLDKEFIAPTVKSFERFRTVHIIYQNAAICASVKGDTKRLEALLTRSIPQLSESKFLDKE